MNAPFSTLKKLDEKDPRGSFDEIRAFACIRDENLRLPYLLDYHRSLGVGRFFFIDNGSTDGSVDFLLAQDDCHVFACNGRFFAENVEPPVWSNALRTVFGDGHWCLSLDADEMFVYPHCEKVGLRALCDFLDESGANAMVSLVIDMYGQGKVMQAAYRRGESFLDACPYFDPDLGYEIAEDGGYPPVLTFSKFRERAFWSAEHRSQRPPCITQVPLVKWWKGAAYLVAQHSLSYARLSDLQGGILHFKFMPGFYASVKSSIQENEDVNEKGLQERHTYVDTLAKNPELSLVHEKSVKYRDSTQLVELGWMRSSPHYDAIVKPFAMSS